LKRNRIINGTIDVGKIDVGECCLSVFDRVNGVVHLRGIVKRLEFTIALATVPSILDGTVAGEATVSSTQSRSRYR